MFLKNELSNFLSIIQDLILSNLIYYSTLQIKEELFIKFSVA